MLRTKGNETTTITKKSEAMMNLKRNVINADGFLEEDVKGIISLYNELVPGDNTKPINIKMIMNEAFPKFEETIGIDSFKKVKKYFGIGCKASKKDINDVRSLIAKLRTIENAQHYIVGYKELVKQIADKLYNAPEEMNDLEKAKVIRMFFIIFANNEVFLEDYIGAMLNNKKEILFSETRALANNKLLIGPEELINIFAMKVKQSDGYYYDMMLLPFKRMYLEYNRHKRELAEVLEFAELKYDKEKNCFSSVNKCMPGATFGKIRNLKHKIHQVRTAYPIELFCNKSAVEEKIDITDLYVIYKTLTIYPWKEIAKKKMLKYRTFAGAKFVDREQDCYELFDDFLISNDAEAGYWIALLHYVAEHEVVLQTKVDGNGGTLPETKFYNLGLLFEVFKFAKEMGYIDKKTKAIRDFEIANRLLNLEGAEEKFLKLKKQQVKLEEMKELLGIDYEFEEKILGIQKTEEQKTVEAENSLAETVVKFVLDNGYAKSEADISMDLIENVFILGNEENIQKFSNGKINGSDLEKRIGFEVEFAEAYFNTSKIDIKAIEAKLQEIKKWRKKEQVNKSKLLIALYCYLVKNGITCGPKNKQVKRNKGLKPEILEKLIA